MKRKRNASLITQIADLSTLWNEALDQSCSTILTQQWIKSHGNRWKNSTILIDLIKKIHFCHSWYQKVLPINISGVTEKNYFHKNNLDTSFQCNKRPLFDKEIEWLEKESKVILWHYNEKIWQSRSVWDIWQLHYYKSIVKQKLNSTEMADSLPVILKLTITITKIVSFVDVKFSLTRIQVFLMKDLTSNQYMSVEFSNTL